MRQERRRRKNESLENNQVLFDLGSSLSNSYFSDHEPSSPTIGKNFNYPQYRSTTPTGTNNNTNRRK